jgi:hypothetical protein
MERTMNIIEFPRPLNPPNKAFDYGFKIEHRFYKSTIDTVKEHPFMENIRKAVLKYRMQSAAHFDVDVRIEQATQSRLLREDWATDPSFQIIVKFTDFKGPLIYTCQPKFRTDHKKNVLVPRNRIMVVGSGRPMAINNFLAKNFPAFEEKVSIETMQAWWKDNGKRFDWAGLPTELKEQVVQSCLHQPVSRDQYKEKVRRHKSRFQPRGGVGREFGIYEIVDQLGDWSSLLGASHQIRAITLRLCFVGSSDMVYNKGFCLFTWSYATFQDAIHRLGRYYQMVTTNSLPVDDQSQALAECYKQHPKIHQHLEQYATFRHGLRRIYMTMDFFAFMRFFKVTDGGFQRYIKPGSTSYEIFEQIPHLAEIVFELPGKPRKGWKNIPGPGPMLFHNDQPCPRILHRLIYERIAEVLTMCSRVEVCGFVDDDEKARLKELREAAVKKSEWTAADYAELYAECGGGIELEESVQPGSWLTKAEEEDETPPTTTTEETVDNFFPPECRCEDKCQMLFDRRQTY